MIAIVETGNAIQFLVNRVLFACLIGRVVVDFFAKNLGAPRRVHTLTHSLLPTRVNYYYYYLLVVVLNSSSSSSSSVVVFDCRHI